MPRRYSDDLKARAVILYSDYWLTVQQICKYLGIKKTLVYKLINQYESGLVRGRRYPSGCPRTIDADDEDYITSLIKHRPCLYLDEIQEALLQARGRQISIPVLCHVLRKLKFTRKICSVKALERNENQRAYFMLHMARLAPHLDMLMFIDEAARNRQTSFRKYGCALRGSRYHTRPLILAPEA
ncbi:hypothetical protein F5878DRAFT_654584 [Lentinula raphanica]|uniref:Homeodomain-like protein n=1 Tax=Lentinula raphanica TaxID=153919 RepID=A0AA38NXV5_9AGAR|nr:hypothetical protein F5878DRAFT_654584 [Lentinula raphanica]